MVFSEKLLVLITPLKQNRGTQMIRTRRKLYGLFRRRQYKMDMLFKSRGIFYFSSDHNLAPKKIINSSTIIFDS
eukprot:snap_masked-scaffold_2-processed-gene-19.8-mRNA-1 protein AED:1.00 eAED:1.00 QI:0/0/0/0/1/1/2/0/73